jgi:integrase/recombinase XerD
VKPRPVSPPDLAGRWLAKFFTDHLAGERAVSPRTMASYRDAMKLLLTWLRDAERIPPEKLRLADIDRARVLRFLDWLEAERSCSSATRNQRLAVIKSFCRYTAVEQPDHLDQVTQILAIRQKKTPAPQLGHLTGDEVKALLAEPGTASTRAARDTVLLALAYDTAARVQELCDLDVADIRRSQPMTVAIHGKGSKVRYLPVMAPTAQLVADYLERREPHPGLGADGGPLFHGPNHSRLTRSGVAKLLDRHVQAVRARDPAWAPGLPVTPHTLRRTRAMHLVQAGVNLIYIRDLLGHADVSTTGILLRLRAKVLVKAVWVCGRRRSHTARLARNAALLAGPMGLAGGDVRAAVDLVHELPVHRSGSFEGVGELTEVCL